MLSAKPMEPVAVAFPTALPGALPSEAALHTLTVSGRALAAVPVSAAVSPSLPPSRRTSGDSVPTLSREASAQDREQPHRPPALGLAARASSASLLAVPEDEHASAADVLDASQQQQQVSCVHSLGGRPVKPRAPPTMSL